MWQLTANDLTYFWTIFGRTTRHALTVPKIFTGGGHVVIIVPLEREGHKFDSFHRRPLGHPTVNR